MADLPDMLSGIFLQTGLDRFLVICPTSEMAANCRVGKANGSRERAPDDRLRVPTIQQR